MSHHILAYHLKINVRQDEQRHIIEADLDDWMSDDEFLNRVSKLTGAHTMGQIVQHLAASDLTSIGCQQVSVRQEKSEAKAGDRDWNDIVGVIS